MNERERYDALIYAIRLSIGRIHSQMPHWSEPASPYQCKGLAQLVSGGLADNSRAMRLAVIQKLLNLAELKSTRDLLKWEAHILISHLKEMGDWKLSDNGKLLIRQTELELSKTAESRAI